MKSLILALGMIGVCGVAMADEQTVILPRDNRPFTAAQSDIVRLIGMGISGSKIEAKVEGAAKIETISNIKELRNGKPLVGRRKSIGPLGSALRAPTGPQARPIPEAAGRGEPVDLGR